MPPPPVASLDIPATTIDFQPRMSWERGYRRWRGRDGRSIDNPPTLDLDGDALYSPFDPRNARHATAESNHTAHSSSQ